MNLQQTIKDQRERITQQIREKFWNKGEKYIQVETADVEVFLDQITQQTAEAVMSAVREMVEAMKEDRKIPYQALRLSGGCPDCGAEVNQSFVDNEFKEAVNQALDDLLTRLQPNQE